MAELCPHTCSVRIEGGNNQVPLLMPSLLLALPPSLQALELRLPCDGPALAALQRFPRLRCLRVTGNGAGIAWSAAGTAAPSGSAAVWSEALEVLSLDYRGPRELDLHGRYLEDAVISTLPDSTAAALAGAAARLARLELRLLWSDAVPQLCGALPALRTLSLHIYCCCHPHVAAAVPMLVALPRLQAVTLALHAHENTELGTDYPQMDEWEQRAEEQRWVDLPPLAGISGLTELRLIGDVALPRDWRQLTGLAVLAVHNDDEAARVHLEDGWLGRLQLGRAGAPHRPVQPDAAVHRGQWSDARCGGCGQPAQPGGGACATAYDLEGAGGGAAARRFRHLLRPGLCSAASLPAHTAYSQLPLPPAQLSLLCCPEASSL
ncbi:hypothetical protein ABPG75_009425 [Micractinium tetrahymenae]